MQVESPGNLVNTEYGGPEEEIPAITYTNITDDEINKGLINKYQKARTAKFCISHLYNAEYPDKYFVYKNNSFKIIMIRGTVVSLRPTFTRIAVTVDDGTGQLECYLEKSIKLEALRGKLQTARNKVLDEFENDKDPILHAALFMQRDSLRKIDAFSLYDRLNLGDVVQVVGNMKEYNKVRICFIHHIFRDRWNTLDADIRYLEYLRHLYEFFYE